MARSRIVTLAATLGLLVTAACSGSGGGASAAGPATTATGATEASAPDALQMAMGRSATDATGPSDDPHLAQASDADDFVARLQRLQQAVFPTHAAPPAHQVGVTTRGVTDDAVRVGIVATTSGDAGSLDACRGALARLARTGAQRTVDAYQEYIVERYGGQTLPYAYDASGSVNGRALDVVDAGAGGAAGPDEGACHDDAGDAARAEADVRDLVEREQVFAVLAPGALGLATTTTLDEEHVPAVGYGRAAVFCGTASAYPVPAPSAAGCDDVADRLAVRDVLLPSYLAAVGRDGRGLRVAVVATTAGARSDADATSVRLQVERAGGTVVADAIADRADLVVVLSPAGDPDVAAGLRAAGYTGDVVAMADPATMTAAATAFRVTGAEGHVADFDSVLAPATGNPSLSLIRADLDAAGWTGVAITPGVVAGWATADLFVDALTRTPEPLTAEAFANFVNGGAYAYRGAADVVCPVVLPLARVAPTPCGALAPATDLRHYDELLAVP